MMTPPQFTRREHRASQVLAAVGRLYPTAWKQVDIFRADRGKDLPDWPSWCFLPLAGAEAIVSSTHDPGPPPRRTPYQYAHHIGVLGALAAWRMTRGVYRYDDTLAAALDDTPMPRELPVSILYRLPEWCVYLETPGLVSLDGQPLAGVWVHMESDDRGADELRLVLDVDGDPATALEQHRLIPIPLILGAGSIAEAVDRVVASGAMRAAEQGLRVDTSRLVGQRAAGLIWPIVSRVLYLCAEEPDLGGRRPVRPQPKRTKDGWKLFPASGITTWPVGERIGAAIRRAIAAEDSRSVNENRGGHASPRPHIRRSHFHGYWTGPKDQPEKRELRLKWLPPIPVNVESVDDLPATIRPVKA